MQCQYRVLLSYSFNNTTFMYQSNLHVVHATQKCCNAGISPKNCFVLSTACDYNEVIHILFVVIQSDTFSA